MDKVKCLEKIKKIHALCNISTKKCDILLENLTYFCQRYNSDSNKEICDSDNSFGGTTLNLIIKSPT